MVFLALMEYAVAYTFSHYNDGEVLGSPVPWQESFSKPPSALANDLNYKADDSFFSNVGPLRTNLLRNSVHNRRNGANQTQSATPVVNFDNSPSDNRFRVKSLPPHGRVPGGDTEAGNASNELSVKGKPRHSIFWDAHLIESYVLVSPSFRAIIRPDDGPVSFSATESNSGR